MSGKKQEHSSTKHAATRPHHVKPSAAAMGRLAASLGHEFNNPLGYVCSSVDYCKNYLTKLHDKTMTSKMLESSMLREEFAQLIEAMHDAQEGLARMNAIMNDLQGFTSLRHVTQEPVNLDDVIASLLKRAGHDELLIDYTPSHTGLRVRGDAIQLSQVFEHLLDNAWQATLALEPHKRTPIRMTCDIRANKVLVWVQDYGVGMSEEVRQNVFEPFMTTYGKQGNIGLGLTLVQQIVLAHGGEIYIQSELNEGTTVLVILDDAFIEDHPLTLTVPAASMEATLEQSLAEASPSIMVVSSDSAASKELALMLADDYDVDVVPDVADALAFLEHTPRVGFVLFDVDQLAAQWSTFYSALTPYYAHHVGLLMGGIPSVELRQRIERDRIPVFSRPLRARATLQRLNYLIHAGQAE